MGLTLFARNNKKTSLRNRHVQLENRENLTKFYISFRRIKSRIVARIIKEKEAIIYDRSFTGKTDINKFKRCSGHFKDIFHPNSGPGNRIDL
jgi:hypothetical protein